MKSTVTLGHSAEPEALLNLTSQSSCIFGFICLTVLTSDINRVKMLPRVNNCVYKQAHYHESQVLCL